MGDPAKCDFRTNWLAGGPHPAIQNVIASDKDGYWQPRDGYQWSAIPPAIRRKALACRSATELENLARTIIIDQSGLSHATPKPVATVMKVLGHAVTILTAFEYGYLSYCK